MVSIPVLTAVISAPSSMQSTARGLRASDRLALSGLTAREAKEYRKLFREEEQTRQGKSSRIDRLERGGELSTSEKYSHEEVKVKGYIWGMLKYCSTGLAWGATSAAGLVFAISNTMAFRPEYHGIGTNIAVVGGLGLLTGLSLFGAFKGLDRWSFGLAHLVEGIRRGSLFDQTTTFDYLDDDTCKRGGKRKGKKGDHAEGKKKGKKSRKGDNDD